MICTDLGCISQRLVTLSFTPHRNSSAFLKSAIDTHIHTHTQTHYLSEQQHLYQIFTPHVTAKPHIPKQRQEELLPVGLTWCVELITYSHIPLCSHLCRPFIGDLAKAAFLTALILS